MNQAATNQGLKERYNTLFVQFLKITQREKLLISVSYTHLTLPTSDLV